MNISPPDPLNIRDGKLEDNWKKWVQRFDIYYIASGLSEKSGQVQTSTFLHVIGEDVLEIYNSFFYAPEDEHKRHDIEDLKARFHAHFIPRKNLTYERYQFFKRIQLPGETIDSYVADLKKLSKSCEFRDLKESLIKDRLVGGIQSDVVRDRLLRETNLDLHKAVQLYKSFDVPQNPKFPPNQTTLSQNQTTLSQNQTGRPLNQMGRPLNQTGVSVSLDQAGGRSKPATVSPNQTKLQDVTEKQRNREKQPRRPRSRKSKPTSGTICSDIKFDYLNARLVYPK